MRLQNLTAVLLFLVFNLSECVYGSKRTNSYKNYNSIPEKKLNDELFKDDFFSQDAVAKMMNIIASNNKHRAANGIPSNRYGSPSQFQQLPSGNPLAELDKSLFDLTGSKSSHQNKYQAPAASFFKTKGQSLQQILAQNDNNNKNLNNNNNNDDLMHLFHRFG
jgi:hypothetical protein